ncbi:MAG: sugar phosphate isomerase/epimerase [Kiritimatiellae bacterium]|nr:sugar phosphate isomerase/epimerase [Kiritimatiellia bacterium]
MRLNRREVLVSLGAAMFSPLGAAPSTALRTSAPAVRFQYALNAATIRSHRLPLPEQLRLAAATGYQGYEPWLSDIEAFVAGGGSLRDLARECADRGLRIVNAIGFAKWIVEDAAERARALEQLRREMGMIAALGGQCIAAPPAGGTKAEPRIGLDVIAERFAAVSAIGTSEGVTPLLEIWGASAHLSTLAEAAYVLVRSGRANAGLLADVYHIVRGGSPVSGLRAFNGAMLRCFHMNDVPAEPPREQLRDAHRVWPGDGAAPLAEILRILADSGAEVTLSLELFNEEYWKLPAAEIARIGLEKMRTAVRAAGLA